RLRALLNSVGFKSVFLLGHSMGGSIAQEFCRACADNVRGLILADSRRGGAPDRLQERLKSIRSMNPLQLAAERAPKLLRRNAPADLVQEAVSIMSEVRPAGYEFAAVALAESDTRGVLETLHVPLLLIWGAEDEITPVWPEMPPHAQSKIIPDAGHL